MQRLALARAMVVEPELLLLDEPTANLDPSATEDVERLIVAMAERGTKVLLVSYNLGLMLLLGAVSTQPILDVVLAGGLTWAAHSSVAVVLLVMSFAAQGTVPPDAAFALVLGANLGTAINPVLEGASGSDPAARRLPLGNLFNRIIGVAVALTLLPQLGRWMVIFEPNNARAVADFHTAFNVALALLFFPILGPMAGLLRRILPARVSESDASQPLYLDPNARDTPVVAIGLAAREALRMTDILEMLLQGFRDGLERPDRRLISQSRRIDDIIDKLTAAIKSYVISLVV